MLRRYNCYTDTIATDVHTTTSTAAVMDRRITSDYLTNRPTDTDHRQTKGRKDKRTDIQTDRHTNRQTCTQIHIKTDTENRGQTDKRTHQQTNNHRNGQVNIETMHGTDRANGRKRNGWTDRAGQRRAERGTKGSRRCWVMFSTMMKMIMTDLCSEIAFLMTDMGSGDRDIEAQTQADIDTRPEMETETEIASRALITELVVLIQPE